MARYGEDQAHTFQARMYPDGYRYRDWVIKAFNDDMPYDRFVVEQIAGDLLDGPEPASSTWPPSASSPSGRSTTARRQPTSWTTASTR